MKSYYYPISSHDFSYENIFSSESVSPPVFYRKRGFGISYWTLLPEYQLDDVIVLYDDIPLFEIDKPDAVGFVLQVYEPALDPLALQEIDRGIFFYSKTIYLAKPNFRIIFFSDRDRMLALLRSETSLPTKDLLKYRANLVVAGDVERKKYDTHRLSAISFPDLVEREIQFDRNYNFFKGFIYGVAVGLLANSVPQELMLKKRLREIYNRFAELNNRVETSRPGSLTREKDGGVSLLTRELNELFEKTRHFGYTIFPRTVVSTNDLENFLLDQYPKDFELISPKLFLAFKRIDDKIFSRNEYLKIESMYLERRPDRSPMSAFTEMQKQLEEYYSSAANFQQKALHRRSHAVDRFRSALGAFESFLDKLIAERSAQNGFDLSSIRYNPSTAAVTIGDNFAHSGSVDLFQFQLLVSIVLRNPRRKIGPTGRETLFDIIDSVKAQLPNGGELTELYDYLANESKFFSLDNINSVVLKNFVAFIFNPDSIEKLSSFSQSKNLEEQWIGYALWCSYNGFANISKNFLRPVFDAENNPVQGYIDFYLFQIFHLRTMQDDILLKRPADEAVHTNELRDKLENLFDIHFAPIKGMSREQFRNLINVTDRTKFIKILRENFRVSKVEAGFLFDKVTDLGTNRLL